MEDLVGTIDLTTVLLYSFWLFFAYLIYYLQKESRREGYPLESDETGRIDKTGGFFTPDKKIYRMPHGHAPVVKPDGKRETRALKLKPLRVWSGAPKEPTGNPMLDGVGPASYAERADVPDLTSEGDVKIVPMRIVPDFKIASGDSDPLGFRVIGCDGEVGGSVTDVWVDLAERVIRFYEVQPSGAAERTRVLLPANFAVPTPRSRPRRLYVHAVTGAQFADVPKTKHREQVTLLEEDKIYGYYGGGLMYATEQRRRPVWSTFDLN